MMNVQANLKKFEESIKSMRHELIYSKRTTFYIFLGLLMKKLSLEKEYKQLIDWDSILNQLSAERVQAFQQALEKMTEIEGLQFLTDRTDKDEKVSEADRLEILLNTIIPPINEFDVFDKQVIHDLFKSISGILRESSKEISGEFHLNDFFYNLIDAMMALKPQQSVYVFGPLDRNFLIETLYRNKDKALTLTAQIEDKMDYLITKILFYLFGADSNQITNEDFISQPITEENGYDLKQFDYVISASLNPRKKIDKNQIIKEDRFNRFSRGAKVNATDFYHWAVTDHGIASLKDTGKFFNFIFGTPLISSTSANARRNLIEDRVQSKVFQFNSPSHFHMRFSLFLGVFKKIAEPPKEVFMANFFELYTGIKDPTEEEQKELENRKEKIKEIAVQEKEIEETSQFVKISELKENNVSLSPSSYIFEMPEMTKEEKKLFNTLNKNTEKVYLDGIAKVFKGRTLSKEDREEVKRNYTPVKLIKIKDISKEGIIDWVNSEQLRLSEKNLEKYANKVLEVGDILIPSIGNIERIGIIREIPQYKQKDQMVIPDSNIIVIRVEQEKYSPELLFNLLTGPYGKYLIKKFSKGSGTLSINTQVLTQAKIPVIDQEKQQVFQQKLGGINEQIREYRDKIAELEGKKDTLLERIIKEEKEK